MNVTAEQFHEDLCLTIHEGAQGQVAVADIGFPEAEPEHQTIVDITEWDNRDTGVTWLWIDKVRYVSVNPFDLIENMVENCLPWIQDETDVTVAEVEQALAVLKRASGS